MLNLLFITNSPEIAIAAEKAGVDRIWIDLETVGKDQRQKGKDTVKSHHSINDIRIIAPVLSISDVLVRINPWSSYSYDEVDAVIEAGADIIMLPYWKTETEVESFLAYVNRRCRTVLLLETKEAVRCLDDILLHQDVEEIHVGLNDLQISYGYPYMFEPYATGLIDELARKLNNRAVKFGVGGIGRFDAGFLPSPEQLIIEQYRIGSSAVILSRSFCNSEKMETPMQIGELLEKNIKVLREIEDKASRMSTKELNENHKQLVKHIIDNIEGL